MGTVCIALLHEAEEAVEIAVFVLSCRVCGYHIEDVVVRAAQSHARARSCDVVGHYRETSHNAPARRVYSDSGFSWDGQSWRGDSAVLRELPPRLSVDSASLPYFLGSDAPVGMGA